MTKEEILEKSRRENKDFDEREYQVLIQAGNMARGIGLVLCCLVVFLNIRFDGPRSVRCAAWAINFGMMAVQYWVSAIRLKKTGDWVMAVLISVFFLLTGVDFIICTISGV